MGATKSESLLIRKLATLVSLSKKEQSFLEALENGARTFGAGTELTRDGEPYWSVFVLLEGWGYRAITLSTGRRQILSFVLPGDFVGFFSTARRTAVTTVTLQTSARVAQFPKSDLLSLYESHPRLASALSWHYMILAEQVVRLGRRNAYQRTAHLLLELWQRLRIVGVINGDSFPFPFSQEDLADALGLSVVHTNRVLNQLRREGLLEFRIIV